MCIHACMGSACMCVCACMHVSCNKERLQLCAKQLLSHNNTLPISDPYTGEASLLHSTTTLASTSTHHPPPSSIAITAPSTDKYSYYNTARTPTEEEHYYSNPRWPTNPNPEEDQCQSRTYSYPDRDTFMARSQHPDHTLWDSYESTGQDSYQGGSYISHSEIEREAHSASHEHLELERTDTDETAARESPLPTSSPVHPDTTDDHKYTGLHMQTIESPHSYTSLGKNRTTSEQSSHAAVPEQQTYDTLSPPPGSHVYTTPSKKLNSPSHHLQATKKWKDGISNGSGKRERVKAARLPVHLQHGYVNTQGLDASQPRSMAGRGKSEAPKKARYQGLIGRDYAASYAKAVRQIQPEVEETTNQ